ncbi:hypothetical protein G6F56_003322 [Rhizopus delemar]|nr:hypothetical protein G6F56_003322 [Rhizopus delemar]
MKVQDASPTDELFKNWLNQLSYNLYFQNTRLRVPPYIYRTVDFTNLINRVYPSEKPLTATQDSTIFAALAILTSRNTTVDSISSSVPSLISGEIYTLSSVDKADVSNSGDITDEELFQTSTEYVQTDL